MRIWAVANQKGGVGKTTTAVSLGGWLALAGERTLLVDLDPHGSLTVYFGIDPDTVPHSVYRLFQRAADGQPARPQETIATTRFEHLSLLPASSALATVDRQLGARRGMGRVVVCALQELAQAYDNVIIDCPPLLGILMVNGLAASEHLIIPVQTEFLALKGLERMLHTLHMIRRSRGSDIPYTVVPTLFDRRTRASKETLAVLHRRHAQVLWDGVIPVDTQFREASQAGVPLPMRMPRARGASAYAGLLSVLRPDLSAGLPERLAS